MPASRDLSAFAPPDDRVAVSPHPSHVHERIPLDKRFCLILSLSAVVFLLLGAAGYAIFDLLHSKSLEPVSPISHHVCTTPSCIDTSARILHKMDLSQDPCHDSYRAYCGKWHELSEIPPDMSSIDTSFTKIHHEIREELHSAVESWGCPAPESVSTDQSQVSNWRALAGCLYQACMDEDALNAAGSKPLLEHFRTHLPFLFPLDPVAPASSSERPRVLAELMARLNANQVASFFMFYAHQHPQDAENPGSIPHVAASGLGLGYDIYVAEDPGARKMRSHYLDHITNLFRLFDIARNATPQDEDNTSSSSPSSYRLRAEEVLLFETGLRNLQLSPAEARDPVLTTHVMSFKAASDLLGGSLDLEVYFANLVHLGVIPERLHAVYFQATSDFVVDQPEFYRSLPDLLDRTSWSTLMDYFLLRGIRSVLGSLGGEWLAEQRRYTQAVSGVEQGGERWKECLYSVRQHLGWIVGEAFVVAGGTEDAKRKRQLAEQVVADVRTAFRRSLKELDWMDASTKKEALLKEEKLTARLGFPEWLLVSPEKRILDMYGSALAAKNYLLLAGSENMTTVDALYESLALRRSAAAPELEQDGWGDFGHFVLRLSSFLQLGGVKFAWSSLGDVADPHLWALTPDEVNAYYSPSLNEMVFPASIFRPPFMELPAEDDPVLARIGKLALTYGALGAVAGHELTHAFDDAGSTMDADGVLRNWWTEKSRSNFLQASECLVKQYSAFPVFGLGNGEIRVNGLLTLGENIADAGGIKLAMKALEIALDREPEEVKEAFRRNVQLTAEQQHVVSHAEEEDGGEEGISGMEPFFVAAGKKRAVPELLPGLRMSPYQLAVAAFAQVWCTKSKEETLRGLVASDPHAPGAARVVGSVRNLKGYREMYSCAEDAPLAAEEIGGPAGSGALHCEVW